MKNKVTTLDLKVPPASIHIVKVNNIRTFMEECFIKEFPRFSLPSLAVEACVCHSYADYGAQHWMIFKKSPAPRTIAHESIHVVDYLCDAYGIDDSEFRGYLIGYIVEQITNKK